MLDYPKTPVTVRSPNAGFLERTKHVNFTRQLGRFGLERGGAFNRDKINDLGQVVGESTTGCDPSSERPFLWTKADGMQDLGAPPGVFGGLTAINTFGQVVGTFCLQPCSGSEHGFIWTKATGWLDLNDLIPADSGWVLVVPFDINAWGQITGYGLINGQVHAFLLTPNILRR